MVWSHGIGMVTWYWYEWDMVWVFHTMVPWYLYGAHIPPSEWVAWRYPYIKEFIYLIGTLNWVTEVVQGGNKS